MKLVVCKYPDSPWIQARMKYPHPWTALVPGNRIQLAMDVVSQPVVRDEDKLVRDILAAST